MNSVGGGHETGDETDRKSLDPRGQDVRLAELAKKLEGLKQPAPEDASRLETARGLAGIGAALRFGSEFVAGVIVGFVIGYTIDQLFGTSPWGMIVFLLLGFAAGVLNILRSSGRAADPFSGGTGGKTDDE